MKLPDSVETFAVRLTGSSSSIGQHRTRNRGHTTRLKQETAQARERLQAAELNKLAAITAHNATLRTLSEVQAELDRLVALDAADSTQPSGLTSSAQSFLQLELERTQNELVASRTLLEGAEQRISQFESELSRLKRPAQQNVVVPMKERQPWYCPEEHRHPYWRQYTRLLEARDGAPQRSRVSIRQRTRPSGRWLIRPRRRRTRQEDWSWHTHKVERRPTSPA